MDLSKVLSSPPAGKAPPTPSTAPAPAPAPEIKPPSLLEAVAAKLRETKQKEAAARKEAIDGPTAPTGPAEIEAPPGLPQAYIDVNFKNQPVPQPIDMSAVEASEAASEVLAVRRIPGGESMCNATNIPFTPGYEPPLVSARIAQGARVFVSRAAKEINDHGEEAIEAARTPKTPTLAHPDMSKPGRFISGDSPPYRPGA